VIRPADARGSASVQKDSAPSDFRSAACRSILNDEAIAAAHVLADFDHHFAVGEAADLGFTIFTPRCSVTSRASAWFEFPVKTFELVFDPVRHFNCLAS